MNVSGVIFDVFVVYCNVFGGRLVMYYVLKIVWYVCVVVL